jgi:hypothetical protein
MAGLDKRMNSRRSQGGAADRSSREIENLVQFVFVSVKLCLRGGLRLSPAGGCTGGCSCTDAVSLVRSRPTAWRSRGGGRACCHVSRVT